MHQNPHSMASLLDIAIYKPLLAHMPHTETAPLHVRGRASSCHSYGEIHRLYIEMIGKKVGWTYWMLLPQRTMEHGTMS